MRLWIVHASTGSDKEEITILDEALLRDVEANPDRLDGRIVQKEFCPKGWRLERIVEVETVPGCRDAHLLPIGFEFRRI